MHRAYVVSVFRRGSWCMWFVMKFECISGERCERNSIARDDLTWLSCPLFIHEKKNSNSIDCTRRCYHDVVDRPNDVEGREADLTRKTCIHNQILASFIVFVHLHSRSLICISSCWASCHQHCCIVFVDVSLRRIVTMSCFAFIKSCSLCEISHHRMHSSSRRIQLSFTSHLESNQMSGVLQSPIHELWARPQPRNLYRASKQKLNRPESPRKTNPVKPTVRCTL
jgi:hypothetical protein